MELPQARYCARNGEHVASAAWINPHREIARNGEIVNGGEMENARGLLLDQLEIGRLQLQPGLADVAFHDLKVTSGPSRELSNPRDLVGGTCEQRRLDQQDEI